MIQGEIKLKGFGLQETPYIKFLEEEKANKKPKRNDFIRALEIE